MSTANCIGKRYDEMDIMRGVAILMVLLYHSILVYPINLVETNSACGFLHAFLFSVEMPVFFFVSGFCLVYKGKYLPYLGKKSLRILIPHIIFGVLDIIVRIAGASFVSSSSGLGDSIIDFLLYGGSDWYLLSLFIMMLIAPAIYKLVRLNKPAKIMVIACVILLYLFQNKIPGYFSARNVVVYLPFFLAGILFRLRKDSSDNSVSLLKRFAMFLIFLITGIGLFIVMRWEGWNGQPEAWNLLFGADSSIHEIRETLACEIWPGLDILRIKLIYLTGTILGQFLLVSALYQIVIITAARFKNWFLRECSRYSLQMYLFDGYLLVLTRVLIVSIAGVTNAWVIIAFNFVIDTAGVFLISKYILGKWRILRIMTGIPDRGDNIK